MNATLPDKPAMHDPPAKSSSGVIVVIILAVLAIPLALAGAIFVGSVFLYNSDRVEMTATPTLGEDVATDSEMRTTSEEFQTRFDAAMNIHDLGERDTAFAGLAKSAAVAGDDRIAVKAVSNIHDQEVRDAALSEAGTLLAKAGNAKAGMALVNRIADIQIRDKALAKIAKGE